MEWQCRNRRLNLKRRPLLMGILNVTPDSFSDGYASTKAALDQAARLVSAGADILDVGGESTRPGSESVPEEEELARVIPVIEAVTSRVDITVSVDTQKPAVAAAAVAAGAHIINHVSASLDYREMLPVLQESTVGYVAMHMLARPKTMQTDPHYDDVVAEVGNDLAAVGEASAAAGINADRLLYDPGIGFGKTLDHNLALLRHLPELSLRLERPLLLGVSRKSWLGHLLKAPLEPVDERDAYTAMTSAWAPFPIVAVHRVHNVRWVKRALRLRAALESVKAPHG